MTGVILNGVLLAAVILFIILDQAEGKNLKDSNSMLLFALWAIHFQMVFK